MSLFLDQMRDRSRARLAAARATRTDETVREAALSAAPLRGIERFGSNFDLIAEVKRRSPAEGALPDRDPAAVAGSYQRGGAGIISVLTESSEFGGSPDVLAAVRAVVDLPVMAKDFLVDPYQVYEARESGADGVLLIARLVGEVTLAAMAAAVVETGMFALVEAFDSDDLAVIDRLGVSSPHFLVGVNCRDLTTLEVAPQRFVEMAAHLPSSMLRVAESSMLAPEDVETVAGIGYDAALVGSSLMRSEEPEHLVARMVGAGRRARSGARR